MGDSRSENKLASPSPGKRTPGWSKCVSQARSAMQSFLYEEAGSHCEVALKAPGLRPESEAVIRCLLAEALESLAQFSKSLMVLTGYEDDAHRRTVSLSAQSEICFRLGSAYGATDLPKAIAYAKQSIILAQEVNDAQSKAKSRILLGTLYRRLGELWFARDHFSKVIGENQGQPLLLAQAYNGIGIVYFLEGEFDTAKQSLYQALEALSLIDAPLMQGSTDINLAAIASLQGQMQESALLIERALPSLERARHPRLIITAYSNLGYSLLRLGELRRAEEALNEALSRARHCEAPLVVATTLETLADLNYLKGHFDEAEKLLAESLSSLKELKVGFNYAVALLVQGRGRLLAGDVSNASSSFRQSLEICERMGDPRGRAAAQLCLIEAHLALGETATAQELLKSIKEEIERIDTNNLMGHLREITGSVELASNQAAVAVRCFNQAISIREVMGDRYRLGVANCYLAEAQLQCGELTLANQSLKTAKNIFEELEAQPMLDRVQALSQSFKTPPPTNPVHSGISNQIISVITRLLDAEFSQEVLLREMIRILSEELQFSPVIFFKETNEILEPLAWRGCTEAFASELGRCLMKNEIDLREASLYSFSEQHQIKFLYLRKQQSPLPDSLLELLIKQFKIGLERGTTQHRSEFLAAPSFAEKNQISLPGLVYRSEAMKKIVEQVLSLRSSEITVLITGETGTGKELVARAIHAYSKRAAHSFIPFNCASAPRELIESQLFGHRRGAFTGATADFPGMIGAAEKGTLFLDEIGELAREMQPKLLRFFQNGEVQRLGEVSPRIADVRILAATNCDLEEMIATQQFRADLYYRLNVIEFRMPPLRERREEIPPLTEHFLARNLAQSDKQDISISSKALSLLKQYDWPGNARQLENEMQRLVALTPAGTEITEDLLSANIRNQSKIRLISALPSSFKHSLAEALADTEHQVISEALTRHKGNISRVAIELGVSRYGLRKILRRHHLLPQPKTA